MTEHRQQALPRILFAGGGTGGHVYPAIAIADAVRTIEPKATIAFIGTKERLEWTAVPKAGYPIHTITVSGFQRSFSAKNLTFPFKLIKGLAESWSLVGAFDPDVVVGTGGYVSGPVLWTASLRGRPTLIQEQNAYAGMTNRLLAGKARRVHIAFPEATRYFPRGKCVISGNPVRQSLYDVDRAEAREYFDLPSDAEVLFVFGGSLGSVPLNEAMKASIESLLEPERRHVIWQAGTRHYEALAAEVSHERLDLLPYIDRMDLAYAASDLVVGRAGAITCSELMATRKPAILIPAKALAEDHQTKNAQSLADRGAAEMLHEDDASKLSALVDELIADRSRLDRMSDALAALAKPNAAFDIAKDVLMLAEETR